MIIKALTIENFKGIREPVRIEFKPITLLFGQNSAGKSTILQALHYARELLERQNADADLTLQGGEFVDLGGFENLVHGYDRNQPVRLRFDLDLNKDDLPEYHSGNRSGKIHSERERQLQEWNLSSRVSSAWVSLTMIWSDWRARSFISQYEVGINGEHFARISAAVDTRRVWISALNFNHPLFISNDDPQDRNEDEPPSSQLELLFEIVTNVKQSTMDYPTESAMRGNVEVELDQDFAVPAWGGSINISEGCLQDLSIHGDDSDVVYDEFTFYINQLIVGPGELLREELKKFRYLGPIREIPPRNYQELRSPDASRWASGLAAWDILYASDDNFISRVSYWMDTKLKTGYSVEMRRYKELKTSSLLYHQLISNDLLDSEEDIRSEILRLPEKRRLVLYDKARDQDLLPQDIGIGISQVLPVVVSALAGTGLLVAIEQPELHIHPRLQTEIGELILRASLDDPENMFLIETHSEHLLLRIMKKMRLFASNMQSYGEEIVDATYDDASYAEDTFYSEDHIYAVNPDHVGVWFIEQCDSKTVVREMPLNKQGELVKAWPDGFFEEGLREVF